MNSKYFPRKANLDISRSFFRIRDFPLPTDQALHGTPAARLLGNTERREEALRSCRKWPPSGSGATSGRGSHLAVRQQELVRRDALLRGCVLGLRQGPGDGASPRRGPCAAALFALRFQRRVRPGRHRVRTPPAPDPALGGRGRPRRPAGLVSVRGSLSLGRLASLQRPAAWILGTARGAQPACPPRQGPGRWKWNPGRSSGRPVRTDKASLGCPAVLLVPAGERAGLASAIRKLGSVRPS